jgi:hypothetical protein
MSLPEMVNVPGLVPCPCPRESLLKMHPRGSAKLPYLGLDPRFPESLIDAEYTIENIQRFDADDRFLVICAHGTTCLDKFEFDPLPANDWKGKCWKEKVQW